MTGPGNSANLEIQETHLSCPFKFLEPYRKEDRDIFFGRDKEIDKIFNNLKENELLVIQGEPGVGKTSIVTCGLASKAPEDDFKIISIDCSDNPKGDFFRQLRDLSKSNSQKPTELLKQLLNEISKNNDKTVLLVFDQFEGFFIRSAPGEREEFTKAFNKLLSSKKLKKLNVKILIILSEIESAKKILFECKQNILAKIENKIYIKKIEEPELIHIMEKTCDHFRMPLESGAAREILKKITPGPLGQLYSLQVYLDRLYGQVKQIPGERRSITKNDVEAIGELNDVLGFILQKKISPKTEVQKYKVLLKTTISPEGNRRKMVVEEIRHSMIGFRCDFEEEQMKRMVKELVALRILKELDNGEVLLLKYPQLAGIIQQLLTYEEKEIIGMQMELEQKLNLYSENKKLLGKEFLKKLDTHRNRENPLITKPDTMAFVKKSREAIEKKEKTKQRRYRWAVSVLILFFILSLFLVWAIKENEKEKIETGAAGVYYLLATTFKEKAEAFAKEKNWQMVKLFVVNSLINRVKAQKYLKEQEQKNLQMDIQLPEKYRDWILKRTIHLDDSGRIYSVGFSPDGKYLAAGFEDMTVKIWDLSKNYDLNTLTGHTAYVESICFSPDGKYLASAGWDRQIILREFPVGTKIQTLTGHSDTVYSLNFSPDGKYLASGGGDRTVRLWRIPGGDKILPFEGHSSAVTSISFCPGQNLLASGSLDNTIRLWQFPDGSKKGTLEGHTRPVTSVSFSPDGKFLASGSWDNTIKLWQVENGTAIEREIATLTGHKGYVESLCFSPDDTDDPDIRYLFSGSSDGTIKVWGIPNKNEISTLTGHNGNVYSLSISPDGKCLASASWDHTIRLWEVSPGKRISDLIEYSKNPEMGNLNVEDLKQELKIFEKQTGFRVEGLKPVPLDKGIIRGNPDDEK